MGLLDGIGADPANALPDAAWNSAQCVILLPDGLARAPMSCRGHDQSWTEPRWLDASRPAHSAKRSLLLLVMNSQARQAIESGSRETQRGWTIVPGVLASVVPLAADLRLNADVLAYEWDGRSLRGTRVDGLAFRPESERPAPEMAHAFINSLSSFADTILPSGIIIHHSGVVPSETVNERAVDAFHRERGFDVMCLGHEYHVAYHYLILPDGAVESGRPERCEGAHARGYNSYLGIALIGDFSRADNPRGRHGLMRPTPAQMQSLIRLCRELRAHYKIPLQHILRHSDVAATHCPGDRFPFQQFLAALERS